MAIRKKEHQVFFSRGLVTDIGPAATLGGGGGIGPPSQPLGNTIGGSGAPPITLNSAVESARRRLDVFPVQLDNAWLSQDDIGGITPVYGTDTGTHANTASATNIESIAFAVSKDATALQILYTGNEEIAGPNYRRRIYSTLYTSSASSVVAKDYTATAATDANDGQFGIVVLRDDLDKNRDSFFWLFSGDGDNEAHQKIQVGTTTTDDAGVVRPDTSDNEVIYLAPDSGGDKNLKGFLKFWVSSIEGDVTGTGPVAESALSLPIRLRRDIPYYLDFVSNDEVDFGDVHDINPTTPDAYTIEVLLRKKDLPTASQFIIGKRNNLAGGTKGWSLYIAANTGYIVWRADDSSTVKTCQSTDSICDGLWHRISAVINGTTSMLLYRDGEQIDTVTTSSLGDLSNANNLTIGQSDSGGQDFTGQITDIRIWDDVRTAGEISASMHRAFAVPNTPSSVNLVGYWPADEGTGTTLTDNAASNDGTISGASWFPNDELGSKVINCGTGSRVAIQFTQRLWGKSYRIYRSLPDGSVPFYEGQFSPVTGSNIYYSDSKDVDLGDVPYLHGDPPPANARVAVTHFDRIFVADGNRVYWSDLGSPESFWTDDDAGSIGNWFDVFPDDGDTITAMARDKDGILVFKSNHIYKLFGRVPAEFSLQEVTLGGVGGGALGTPGMRSFCYVPGGLTFYHMNRVFLYTNGGFRKISQGIEDTLRVSFGEDSSYYSAINMVYYNKRSQVWLSNPNANRTYIFDTTTEQWVGSLTRGFYAMTDVVAYNLPSGFGTETKLIGGGTENDPYRLYELDCDITTGSQWSKFDTSSFTSTVKFSPFTGGDINNIKRFLYVDVLFDVQEMVGTPSSCSFTVTPAIDSTNLTATTISVSALTLVQKRVHIGQMGRQLEITLSNTPASNGRPRWYALTFGYQILSSDYNT